MAKEKIIEWKGVSIPESTYKAILNYLKATKDQAGTEKYASPSEYIRHAVEQKLRKDLGLKQ